jgi:hypothetical protein
MGVKVPVVGKDEATARQERRMVYWSKAVPLMLDVVMGCPLGFVKFSKGSGWFGKDKDGKSIPLPVRNIAGVPVIISSEAEIKDLMTRKGKFAKGPYDKGLATLFFVPNVQGTNLRYVLYDFDIADMPEEEVRPKVLLVAEEMEAKGLTCMPVFTGSSWHLWCKRPDNGIIGDYGGIHEAKGVVGEYIKPTCEKLGIPVRGSVGHVPGQLTVDYQVNKANSPVRIPLSLHHKTGLVALPLTLEEVMVLSKDDAHPDVVMPSLALYHGRMKEFFSFLGSPISAPETREDKSLMKEVLDKYEELVGSKFKKFAATDDEEIDTPYHVTYRRPTKYRCRDCGDYFNKFSKKFGEMKCRKCGSTNISAWDRRGRFWAATDEYDPMEWLHSTAVREANGRWFEGKTGKDRMELLAELGIKHDYTESELADFTKWGATLGPDEVPIALRQELVDKISKRLEVERFGADEDWSEMSDKEIKEAFDFYIKSELPAGLAEEIRARAGNFPKAMVVDARYATEGKCKGCTGTKELGEDGYCQTCRLWLNRKDFNPTGKYSEDPAPWGVKEWNELCEHCGKRLGAHQGGKCPEDTGFSAPIDGKCTECGNECEGLRSVTDPPTGQILCCICDGEMDEQLVCDKCKERPMDDIQDTEEPVWHGAEKFSSPGLVEGRGVLEYFSEYYPDYDLWAWQRTCYMWEDRNSDFFMVIGKNKKSGKTSIVELEHKQDSPHLGAPEGLDAWQVVRRQELSVVPGEAMKETREFLKSSRHWKFHGGVCGGNAGWRLEKWHYVPENWTGVNLRTVFANPSEGYGAPGSAPPSPPFINSLKIWRARCSACGWRIPSMAFNDCGLCFFCCHRLHRPKDRNHSTVLSAPKCSEGEQECDLDPHGLSYKDYKEAVEGEGWAIGDYKDMISKSDTDEEREALTHIKEEEEEHLDELHDLMEKSDWTIESLSRRALKTAIQDEIKSRPSGRWFARYDPLSRIILTDRIEKLQQKKYGAIDKSAYCPVCGLKLSEGKCAVCEWRSVSKTYSAPGDLKNALDFWDEPPGDIPRPQADINTCAVCGARFDIAEEGFLWECERCGSPFCCRDCMDRHDCKGGN